MKITEPLAASSHNWAEQGQRLQAVAHSPAGILSLTLSSGPGGDCDIL